MRPASLRVSAPATLLLLGASLLCACELIGPREPGVDPSTPEAMLLRDHVKRKAVYAIDGATEPWAQYVYAYDAAGRLAEITRRAAPDGKVYGYERYTYAGDRQQPGRKEDYHLQHDETFALLASTRYTYDGDRLAEEVTTYPQSGAGAERITYDYADGRLVRKSFYGGDALQHFLRYTYDSDGKAAGEYTYDADGSPTTHVVFRYDDGRRTGMDVFLAATGEHVRALRYEYDASGRLAGETLEVLVLWSSMASFRIRYEYD